MNKMSKLRTEYVKSLGIELVVGDTFSAIGETYIIGDYNVLSLNSTDPFNKFRFITHLAKRRNQLKVQPVGNDVPIICFPCPNGKAKNINWADVTLWAPSYSKLLEMQAIHDEKNASDEVEVKELTLIDLRSTKWDLSEQSEVERRAWQEAFFKLGGRWIDGECFAACLSVRFYFIDEVGQLSLMGRNDKFQESSFKKMHFNDLVPAQQGEAMLETFKKDNLVYTQEMKERGQSLTGGMEYLDDDGQRCKFITLTHTNMIIGHQFEHPDINDVPCISVCSTSEIKPIDTRTPEQVQVDEVAKSLAFSNNSSNKWKDFINDAEALQKYGLLAEIVKPLA